MPNAPLLSVLCLAAFAASALALAPSRALAQDSAPDLAQGSGPGPAADAPAAAGAVTASVAVEALRPVLDADGQPELDAGGAPVLGFQPLADGAALLPGDTIRYVVALRNAGADVEALTAALDIPAAARLLAGTVAASVPATFELGSAADAAAAEPLFVEIDGARVENPRLAAAPAPFDQLRTTIGRLPGGATATVTYHLVVR